MHALCTPEIADKASDDIHQRWIDGSLDANKLTSLLRLVEFRLGAYSTPCTEDEEAHRKIGEDIDDMRRVLDIAIMLARKAEEFLDEGHLAAVWPHRNDREISEDCLRVLDAHKWARDRYAELLPTQDELDDSFDRSRQARKAFVQAEKDECVALAALVDYEPTNPAELRRKADYLLRLGEGALGQEHVSALLCSLRNFMAARHG